MKFLFVTPGYPGLPEADHGSGIGTYVRDVSGSLADRGHECHVLTWSLTGRAACRTVGDVTVHLTPRGYWPVVERVIPGGRAVASRYFAVRRLDRQHRFDWIEIQSDAGVDLGIQYGFRGKTILRVHTTLHQMCEHKQTRLTPAVRHWLRREKASFAAAELVITHSAQHATELRTAWPQLNAIRVVPHGCRSPAGTRPVGWPDAAVPRFLVVGTMDRRKGTDRLRPTLKAYAAKFGRCELRIVSSSPSHAVGEFGLDGLSAEGVDVSFLGRVGDDALWEEYQTATALVHLARYESFGLPLIEAAAVALPVVATSTGVAADLLVGELSGLLVDGDSPADCARRLKAAVFGRMQFGAALQREFATRFTQDQMADNYLKIIEAWSLERPAGRGVAASVGGVS